MTATRFFSEDNGNNLESLLHAIESEHGAIEHPDSISWTIEGLRLIVAQRWFKPLRCVVSDVTDGAAGEWDQSGAASELAIAKVISDPLGRGARICFSLAVTLDKRLHTFPAHDHLRVGAEERVARDSFTTFNRFEQ